MFGSTSRPSIEGTLAEWWPAPVRGAHGFAASDGRVRFGGNCDHTDSLFLWKLGAATVEQLASWDGRRPITRFRAFGRGHLLFLAAASDMPFVELRTL